MAAKFSMDLTAVLGQLVENYVKLPLVQKVMLPLVLIGSVMGLVYAAKWANQPDFTLLYSDLKPVDASAVIAKLREKKIKYEVRGDGSSIAIDKPEMVHELRMELAGEGLPRGGSVGFEIFQGVNLGTTSFQELIKKQIALQGELERTISSIQGVNGARVHIAQPEKSVLAKQAKETTASVLLNISPGTELTKKQIKGITNLVAGSIEGLKRENVTIVDIAGNLLSDQDNEENLGIEATRLQYQREVEKGYVQRVEAMLSKVLGDGKVIARVTADLDYSQTDREEESFDPGGQVLRSERTVEEGSGTAQRGGVPGVVSNLANDPNLLTAPGAGGDRSARREAVKNFEVSRAVSKTSLPRGKLTRLSVAVLVDGTYEAAPGAAPSAAKVFKALDPEELSRIEGIVKSAVGFDSARGDSLTVENIPFHNTEDDFKAQLMSSQETWNKVFQLLYYIGPALFIVLFIVGVIMPLVRFLIKPSEAEVDLTRLLPTGIKELEQELEAERARSATVPTIESSVDMDQLEELMAENSRVVKENPQQAALLIRYWLNDGRL